MVSVTRFGEISPLWQHFINVCQIVEGLIGVWQMFEPTLAKLQCLWATFNCNTWPNIEK